MFLIASLLLLLTHTTGATSTLRGQLLPHSQQQQQQLSLSTIFPQATDVEEFIILSDAIYYLRKCTGQRTEKYLPSSVTCHSLNKRKNGSKVAVLSSAEQKYVAIVFAGSENVRNWIVDFDMSLTMFGPIGAPIANVSVHEGFNNAVFEYNLYDEITTMALELLQSLPDDYRLILSGHSLGAADAILTGAAVTHLHPSVTATVINYGCPYTGDEAWVSWANGLENLGVWRIVYRDDIVPRMPDSKNYKHVGHTVQLETKGAKAYYLHYGDEDKGYKGVPKNWESNSLVSPTAEIHHKTHFYKNYILGKMADNPDKYFASAFETKKKMDDDKETSVVSS